MSNASPPRTSPTTSRSGRIRSAARTSSRTLTAPAPSALAGRASSRTTCGWPSRSSAVSSIVTMRSAGIDRPRERVRARGLARARRARHHDVPTRAHHRFEERDRGGVRDRSRRARPTRTREPADREARTVGRERREHRVQPRAVGQARVDHRRRRGRAAVRAVRSPARRCARSRRRRARTRPARADRARSTNTRSGRSP